MSFLPPVVMEMRANASQFLTEQGKVIASAKTTATETEKAAQKEAAAARSSAAEATRAAEQKAAAAETSAKAATVAADKRVLAETRATEAQAKAAQMQAALTDTSTAEQQAAYDKQAAAAARAANAAELAAAKESEAQGKAAAAATASAEAQTAAGKLQVIAAEKTAAAQEVAATRTKVAMNSVVGVANKISAATVLAGAAVAVGSLEMASKFEKSTMLLVTAGGESMGALAGVRKGILDVSTQTGTSAEQMSEGMYIMEKAGYRGAAGLAALKASAQGAKDENVDLATMAQATTDVLLDYGYKMDTAAHATDSSVRVTNMLVAASGAAKTTMTDFAGSMSAVIPIASTAKISFDQIGGAIATMTQHGQTAQQSSQNLANLIQSLVRPNNLASAAMSQLGIDTTDLAEHLSDRGLSGSLKKVSDAILAHMGPDGMVLQKTMKDNANATAAMQKVIAQMPPDLANLSHGLLDGSTTIKQYTKDTKDYGGTAGALGLQLAGLYKANSGVNDQLKAGKPALETYNAAMRDVFGNVTAARAATMLLMNDSHEFEANIKAIGEAGQKTGQDISTWADMQSTLSVKMDQTKQMVSNLGIEMGTKLLPAAKDMIGGFTNLFHGFEQGNPVLLGVAGIIGGALTISAINFGIQMGKTAMKTVNGLIDMGATAIAQSSLFVKGMLADELAIGQFSTKAEIAGFKVKGALGVAGTAAAMFGAAMVLNTIGLEKATVDTDALTKALADFSDTANKAGKTELDSQFSNWDKVFGVTVDGVNGMDSAFHKLLQNDNPLQGMGHWFDPLNKAVGGAQTPLGEIDDRIAKVGDSLGQMAKGGSIDAAAKAFDRAALAWKNQGGNVSDLLDKMPAYKQALDDQAAATGQVLAPQERVNFAMGQVPQKMLDAMDSTQKYTDAAGNVKPITPALQKSLSDAGVSAEGLATDLSKVLDGMLATGLATMTAREATAHMNETMTTAKTAVEDLLKSNVDMSHALTDNASDFDLTSEAGQKLNSKYQDVAKSGEEMAKQASTHGVNAQKDVQQALQDTFNNLVTSGHQMGIVGTNADDLARKVMGIPPDKGIKAWIDDYASSKAADITNALNNIKDKTITVNMVTVHSEIQKDLGISGDSQIPADIARPKGGFTGGAVSSIMGMYDGGLIPGTPPSRSNIDNILATVNGKPLKVRSGEFITNEPMTKVNLPYLKASNAGLNLGDAMASRYASGYVQGASQAPQYASAGSGQHITNNVSVQTNASPDEIARAISWQMRTR